MMRRMTRLLLILSLLCASAPVSAASLPANEGALQPLRAAAISLVQADDDGVVLAVSVPDYQLAEADIEGERYQRIDVPGAVTSARSGAPELPVIRASLGVPAQAQVSVEILESSSKALPAAYRLRPAPVPVTPEDELSAGSLAYVPDPQAYASTEAYPPNVAEITDEGWLREQRVVGLAVYPFQYRAAGGELIHHARILLRVNFEHPATGAAAVPTQTKTESPFEAILQSSLLNYEQAVPWRVAPVAQQGSAAASGARALPTRYKIVVAEDGLYRLTYNDIVQAGIPTNAPAHWRLSNLEDTVAVHITGEGDGTFDPGDELLFYGERFRGDRFAARYPDDSLYWLADNCFYTYCPPQIATYQRDAGLRAEKYTRENVYWLEIEDTPQPRWETYDGTPAGAPIAAYFTDTVRAEQRNSWWAYHYTEEDTWFWDRVQIGTAVTMTTRSYAANLPDVAGVPFTATVRGDLVARMSNASVNPDHRAAFSLNDSPLAGAENVTWDGVNRTGFAGTLAQSALLEGNNQLKLTLYRVSPNVEDTYFNWFEVEYARRFRALGDELWFNGGAAGARGFRTDNFSSNQLWALDITHPLTPTQIANAVIGGASPYTITFEVEQPAGARYYLTTAGNLKSPKSVSASTPADLLDAGNGADYIFITHHDFITPTQDLADYRAAQGLRTKVVDVADVYDLFGGGIFNPEAIKNFLRYAYHHWQAPAPRYVMLVGDGHWNFFGDAPGTYGTPRPVYLPPYLVLADPWQGEVDSSNLLAAIVGNDALPDLLIGRAVVASQAEMQAIADKIKAYEAAPAAAWQRNLSFVAENTPDPAGDFVAEHEAIIASHLPAGYAITRLYQNDFGCVSPADAGCAQIKSAIAGTLNVTGTLIVSFAGHGSSNRWSNESIFTLAGVPTLSNASQLPILLDMTCLTGYYIHPLYPTYFSLAAEMVRSPNKGAIATFSPTGLGLGTGHSLLHSGFYDAIFQDEVRTLGEAALASKMNLYANNYYFDLLNTFTLFGDPALRLPIPLHQPEVSAQNSQKDTLPGGAVHYALTVRNTGSVTDTFTLALQGNAWPAQLSVAAVGPLPPGGQSAVSVSVQAPAGAVHGDSDTVTVLARSQANPNKSDQQALVTSVKIQAGVGVSPGAAAQSGLPGDTLDYTLRITNNGELTDTFSAEVDSAWAVTLAPASPFGPLAPNETLTITASVSIPPTAGNGDASTAAVRLRSRNNPAAVGTANLLTSVSIPSDIIVFPASDAKEGLPGETIAYTLRMTNTSSVSDSFTVQIDSPWPATLTPGSPVGPLAPGAAQALTLRVSIPLTATNGSFAVTHLAFRSQSNPNELASAHTLTGVGIRLGVAVSPATATEAGKAGGSASYELTITNTGNYTDTFTVAANGEWPLTLSPATALGPLPPGGRRSLTVTVDIPASAGLGDSDVATITVHSQTDAAVFARASLQTLAGDPTRRVFLPLVIR